MSLQNFSNRQLELFEKKLISKFNNTNEKKYLTTAMKIKLEIYERLTKGL